jgi:hypothetical protein
MCALPFTILLTPRHVGRVTVAPRVLTLWRVATSCVLPNANLLVTLALAMNIGRVMSPPLITRVRDAQCAVKLQRVPFITSKLSHRIASRIQDSDGGAPYPMQL